MSTGTELSELSNAVVNKTNITIITDSFVNYMDSTWPDSFTFYTT